MSSALPWARYWRGTPSTRVAGVGRPADSVVGRHGVEEEGPGAAVADAVLRRHHQAVARRVGEHGGVGRGHDPGVPHGGVDPLAASSSAASRQAPDRLAHPEQADRPVAGAQPARPASPLPPRRDPHGAAPSWARGWWRDRGARGRRAASAPPPRPTRARRPSCPGWTGPGPGRGCRGGSARRHR